jgi:chaperonin cofactor prefoldin
MTDRTRDRLANWSPVVLAVLSLLGGGLAWAAKAQTERAIAVAVAPVESRVTVLETQREDNRTRLDRIEDKLDRVIEQTARR